MAAQLPARGAGPRWLLGLPRAGAAAAPAGVGAEIAGPGAARAGLLGGRPLGLSPAVPAQAGRPCPHQMTTPRAGARAQHTPAGVVLQDPLLATARTARLGGPLGPPAPTTAAVLPVAIADRRAAAGTVALPLTHRRPALAIGSQRRHRPATRRGRLRRVG